VAMLTHCVCVCVFVFVFGESGRDIKFNVETTAFLYEYD
jgi:hypothetical protein